VNFHIVLGSMTLLAGVALIVVGTDYGRIVNVTMGVIIGSMMVLLGAARIKNAWQNRNE
jgi:multisubunit Na+/H+ antiporter MnhG subunit